MPSLGNFLQGYEIARQGNQQADSAQLQQATVATGLMGALQQQQQQKQLRDLLAQSGGDVEKAMAGAIQSGNIAAAHQLAPILKLQQEAKQRQETIQGMRDLYGPQAVQPNAQQQEPQQLGIGYPVSVAGDASASATQPSAQDAKHARLAQLQKLSVMYAGNPAASASIQREITKFEADTKPMIEHQFPVGDNQVQPHISFDQGQTWKPVPGSKPSAKFAKQVGPTINNPAPVSTIVVKDTTSDTGWSYKDARTGRVTSKGAPQPAGDSRAQAATFKDRTANEKVQSISDDIDTIVSQLEQNPNVAGGRGIIARGMEAASGFIDPTQAPTDAHLFESRIGDLKSRVQLLRSDKRFSKEAMARMDSIIQGTGLGQNAATAIATLRDMQEKMNRDISSSASADKFVIGKTYKDANGNTAVYKGNGKFE